MSNSTPDAPGWLAAARTGCRDALGRALEACRRYLLHIAQEEIPSDLMAKGSASDLVQEAFLDASNGFAHFHGDTETHLRAWLRQLLRRRIAKLGRRYRTTLKRRLSLERPVAGQRSGWIDGNHEVPADLPTPSAQVMDEEQSQALRHALDRLPADYRRVIRLRYEEERSFEEIGTLMQRTPNAARLLWLRAIERVKHELGASHG
jgi:RNA polymerase sigma-70 factor (ECF subfamily)